MSKSALVWIILAVTLPLSIVGLFVEEIWPSAVAIFGGLTIFGVMALEDK